MEIIGRLRQERIAATRPHRPRPETDASGDRVTVSAMGVGIEVSALGCPNKTSGSLLTDSHGGMNRAEARIRQVTGGYRRFLVAVKPSIVTNPLTNHGTAFTRSQRVGHRLIGRFPAHVETLEEQAARLYAQMQSFDSDLRKYVFFGELHNRNETLYDKVLVDHLAGLSPVVYDPTVGEAIKQWSREYRRSRAVYLDINHPEDIAVAFENLDLGPQDVDLLVCSDAEAILGIGDWGVNGTDISVGKLAVYTAAAGIHPERTLAVNLDCGTDNELLLNDPHYLGNRHARIRGERYYAFIDEYLRVASSMFPQALLHFEDFGKENARRILINHRDSYRIFNDDMQGTGAIVISAVINGMRVTGTSFADQRLVVYGAGTAGTSMADQICAGMIRDGLRQEEARGRIWLIDVHGLVTDDPADLPDYQEPYAKPAAQVADWNRTDGRIDLLEVIRKVKPTILISTSTDHGAFTREVIESLCEVVERPIILPLSNLTERIKAMPADAVSWSRGKALIASGIPVTPIEYEGTTFWIGQGNNALLYPGLGLGVLVSGATRVTDGMLLAAAEAVAQQVDPTPLGASLLPEVDHLRASSARVARRVALAAEQDGVATHMPENLVEAIYQAMWQPDYPALD